MMSKFLLVVMAILALFLTEAEATKLRNGNQNSMQFKRSFLKNPVIKCQKDSDCPSGLICGADDECEEPEEE